MCLYNISISTTKILWIKVMRHKYVAQFFTTYTYHLILEGHVYSFTRIRFEPPSGPVRNGYFQFIVVSQQFNCTTSTRPFVGEFMVTPILRRLDVLGQNRTAWHPLSGLKELTTFVGMYPTSPHKTMFVGWLLFKFVCLFVLRVDSNLLKKKSTKSGSKREDRLSDPFFWTGTKYQFGSFFVLASPLHFCKAPRDTQKFSAEVTEDSRVLRARRLYTQPPIASTPGPSPPERPGLDNTTSQSWSDATCPCTTSFSAYFRFVTLFLLKKTRQSTRSGVTGARCLRPWLTRDIVSGMSQVSRRSEFAYINGAPWTPGYLLAFFFFGTSAGTFAVSAGPYINYCNEVGTKNEPDTYFVPVQKKGWKIDPHVSNLIRSREFLFQGVHVHALLLLRVDLNPRILKICASWMSVWNISANYVLVPVKFNLTEIFENHSWSLHLLISAGKGLGTRVWSCSFDFILFHW